MIGLEGDLSGLSVSSLVESKEQTPKHISYIQLIEGIHFDLSYTLLQYIGYKAVSLFSNEC